MDIRRIIAEIDAEIASLEQVKQLLGGVAAAKKQRGRPRKDLVAVSTSVQPKRATLSAAARARISAAQKARWAKKKKAAKGR